LLLHIFSGVLLVILSVIVDGKSLAILISGFFFWEVFCVFFFDIFIQKKVGFFFAFFPNWISWKTLRKCIFLKEVPSCIN
jgi:hypothetical protein